MGLNYVSQMNIGTMTPITVSVAASLTTELSTEIVALGKLTTGLGFSPPSFTASIAALGALSVAIGAAITGGVPSIDFQATAVANAIADLTAQLAQPVTFQALLGGSAGIFAYAYSGAGRQLGSTVTDSLASAWPDGTPTSGNANALIMGVVSPSVWLDVLSVFGVIPSRLNDGLTYVAQCNIGTLCPICVTATAGIIATLQARLDGLIALAVRLAITPPTFVTNLNVISSLVSSLTDALSANLPGVTFQLEAIAKLVASINTKIALLLSLTNALSGTAGVFVYTYDGPANAMGQALSAELASAWRDGSSSALTANALVLGVVTPAVWAVVQAFFGGV